MEVLLDYMVSLPRNLCSLHVILMSYDRKPREPMSDNRNHASDGEDALFRGVLWLALSTEWINNYIEIYSSLFIHIIEPYDLSLHSYKEWRLLGCYAVRFLQEAHCVTFQNTTFLIVTTVKTSNLTSFIYFLLWFKIGLHILFETSCINLNIGGQLWWM
jgi:hypothetical protein